MNLPPVFYRNTNEPKEKQWQRNLLRKWLHKGAILAIHFIKEPDTGRIIRQRDQIHHPSLNSSTSKTTPSRRGPPSVLTVTRSLTFMLLPLVKSMRLV